MFCLHCNHPITNKKKFCNHSCSASYNNNKRRNSKVINSKCLTCNKPTKHKYCSNKCQQIYQNQLLIKNIENNLQVTWNSIRNYLINKIGKCQICGIYSWNNKSLSLQLDHIDGDRSNNCLSNARLLCPNCHSQTPTYGSPNSKNPKGKEIRAKRTKVKVVYVPMS